MRLTLSNFITINQTDNKKFNSNFSKIKARDLIDISDTHRLSEKEKIKGKDVRVQRFLDSKRVESIATYCESENAIFPTPIILSLNSDFILEQRENEIIINTSTEFIDEFGKPFSIIDGQHRIEGIRQYYNKNLAESKDFDLPIIVYYDADQVTAAKIFVTINANQRPVDQSIIHQLFGIMYENSDKYTVQSFSNQIVKVLNQVDNSPFKNSIKMLGRKMNGNEFLSQGTVAKKVAERITSPNRIELDNLAIEKNEEIDKMKNKIFRNYFAADRSDIVSKILINYFSAFSQVFDDLWENDVYITKKAIGFSSLMKLLDEIYQNENDLSQSNLIEIFSKMKETHDKEITKLFGIGGSSESIASKMGNQLSKIYYATKKNE